MSQITEPLSKPALFMEMRTELICLAQYEAAAEEPGADLQTVEFSRDEAAANLIALWRKAEDSGLMRELAGYLTATYGG